ncbi:ATP-binding protein [uncultured Kordia sp.]|uniref:ATP-binding protein n=1 Tax=uncultured Kordia sp. TaxID=507699 RepID=UPI002632B60A|nr:ATP-binding protein [uncultured Kordia sp.]
MTKKYFKHIEVFTPSQPANYTFVERESVNDRLTRAIRTPGKQIIIYGHSGVGKTSILIKKLKEQKIKYITTRCITGMTLKDIVTDAFNQLEMYYLPLKEITKGGKTGGALSASYFGLKATLSTELNDSNKQVVKRAVDLPITPQTLAKFIGKASYCWVLEDYHKIKTEDKILLSQIMKVFMDSSLDYPKLKIIALGAVNSAREVLQYDPEMKSRISEIEVPLMTDDKLLEILEKGEALLNIKFPDYIKNKTINYSNGLPAITHQLALLICEKNNIFQTIRRSRTKEIIVNTFEAALDEYLEENSDTYKSIFEKATKIVHKRKSENPINILNAILLSNQEEITIHSVKANLRLENKNYKGNNLKKYLDELTTPARAEILRFNKNSNSYYFNNPFIKAYCQCALRKDNKKDVNSSRLLQEFKGVLRKELEIAREAYFKDLAQDGDIW